MNPMLVTGVAGFRFERCDLAQGLKRFVAWYRAYYGSGPGSAA